MLLDCREQDEFDTARIASAPARADERTAGAVGELEVEKARRIVVYCHHGGRSTPCRQLAPPPGASGKPRACPAASTSGHKRSTPPCRDTEDSHTTRSTIAMPQRL
ncbi:MAG: rhodanese-like domain-containing protein [Planctomycetaceae bacterium]